jgi:hypothetical protein
MKHLADIVTRKHPLSEDLFQHCYLIAIESGKEITEGFFFNFCEINGHGKEAAST